jgi:LmbE family N-acetylglucosaminyl deacetylase
MQQILVISPHPDDEAIGCGGAISWHVNEGDAVEVIFLTSGEKGGHGKSADETITIREQESRDAAEILKVSNIEFWKEPDGNFEASDRNITRLFEKINDFKPAVIYVPHFDEDHPDHKAAAKLVLQALNLFNGTKVRRPTVWMYEVWTPIQQFDHIIDISPYVELKRQALLEYKSQCEVMSFDEAILGLNRYRGEMHSWPGGDYAEIFKEMKP